MLFCSNLSVQKIIFKTKLILIKTKVLLYLKECLLQWWVYFSHTLVKFQKFCFQIEAREFEGFRITLQIVAQSQKKPEKFQRNNKIRSEKVLFFLSGRDLTYQIRVAYETVEKLLFFLPPYCQCQFQNVFYIIFIVLAAQSAQQLQLFINFWWLASLLCISSFKILV